MVEIEKQALIQILGINTNKKGGKKVGIATSLLNMAVYTRENKPRLTLAADYIRREHPV